MHGLDFLQFMDFSCLAPTGEFDRGASIGPPGVRIADIGGEEFDESPGCILIRSEQRRQL